MVQQAAVLGDAHDVVERAGFQIDVEQDAAADGGVILANAAGVAGLCSWEPGESGEFEIGVLDVDGQVGVLQPISFAYVPAEGLTAAAAGCNEADLAVPFGVLDESDTLEAIMLIIDEDPAGDFNEDGVFNVFDPLAFSKIFDAGCP